MVNLSNEAQRSGGKSFIPTIKSRAPRTVPIKEVSGLDSQSNKNILNPNLIKKMNQQVSGDLAIVGNFSSTASKFNQSSNKNGSLPSFKKTYKKESEIQEDIEKMKSKNTNSSPMDFYLTNLFNGDQINKLVDKEKAQGNLFFTKPKLKKKSNYKEHNQRVQKEGIRENRERLVQDGKDY